MNGGYQRVLSKKSLAQLNRGQSSHIQRLLLPLCVVSSLLAIASVEYYALDGIDYLETQTASRLSKPYSVNSESNADQERVRGVKEVMEHAWNGYEKYAWGADELQPDSKTGKFGVLGGMDGFHGMGASIVDAMSTLHLMGMQEHFDRAKAWIQENMTFEGKDGRGQEVSFFETTIRLLGGLLSAYDLSGEKIFLDKASDLGNRLINVFNGPRTGILLNDAQLPMTRETYDDSDVLLAELGTNLIEFGTLAARTGNETFRLKSEAGLRFLHAKFPDQPLLGTSIRRTTGEIQDTTKSVGAATDSYFEYLLKYWIHGKKMDDHWRDRWVNSTDLALKELQVRPKNRSFSFAGTADRYNGAIRPVVTHLGCFYPGNVALGVISGAVTGMKAIEYLNFAESMMEACYQLYNATATGLGADQLYINLETGEIRNKDRPYLQRPEVVESLFYLWRATHKRKYRDWGWNIIQALNKYCKKEAGYSGVMNADQIPPTSDNSQQSWFLAETLKYLFLLFSDDHVMPLDEWVFNTEAHPVRVRKVEESPWIDWNLVQLSLGERIGPKVKTIYEWFEEAYNSILELYQQEESSES